MGERLAVTATPDQARFNSITQPKQHRLQLLPDDGDVDADLSLVERGLRHRRILVFTDLSPASDAVLQLAINLAAAVEAYLDLTHVLDAFDELFCRANVDLGLAPEHALRSIDEVLRTRVATALRAGVPAVTTSLVGQPALELIRHASRSQAAVLLIAVSNAASLHVGQGVGGDGLGVLRRGLREQTLVVSVDC